MIKFNADTFPFKRVIVVAVIVFSVFAYIAVI